MKEIVAFFLSGKEYGVEVGRIQGLENYMEITPMEGVPDSILGVVDIRGEAVPVMNIKKKLVLPRADVTSNTKIVVFSAGAEKLACVADGISQIFQVEGNDLQNVPQFLKGESTTYVECVAKIDNRLILVINPGRLLTEEEWTYVRKMLTNYEEMRRAKEEPEAEPEGEAEEEPKAEGEAEEEPEAEGEAEEEPKAETEKPVAEEEENND